MGACPSCGAATAADQAFCGTCGAPLAVGCRTCQAPLTPGLRFCTRCGTPVNEDDANAEGPVVPRPEAERRLCSVLFVDLVGFTPLSEGRDPEEVRELLSEYFAIARAVVGRYGGVIEKFIGDAVMAVWGTPIAAEGDAERAVRAALDVVAGVADLGTRIGAPGLAARAGVVTGTVATTPGADGQAMVAGDAVNTAARVQTAAPPGVVLVDTTTRRLAGAAIEFELHGDVELKGKAVPETLWSATQVVSGVGGAQRTDGLEGPFVGRAVEFRLVKDLLHATENERRPRLVLVSGPPGVGKSRLGWELEKYVDGLAETVFWHRGRCPRFGEDTAYWALAEIVRARLGVSDDDDLDLVEDKLGRSLHDLFETDADRTFVGVRLARLLGLPSQAPDLTQSELFAGWRRFFEALARQRTVLLLIEDLHDADEGLLDFVEHLVDWVRDLPVLVLGFTRPELTDRRPGLGTGRGRTLVPLTPLAESAMRELLAGLVHHLPPEAAQAIEAQAQGIPLFAVETVRSLIDRQVVADTGSGYELTGDLGELSVPDTLLGLLTSRLDALDPVARSLAGDAAVIAAPFTADTLRAVSTLEAGHVDAGLAELARRDVVQISADALSPHVGSYSFTHGLLAQVAYQTLSHRDLKERHLRVAAQLEASPRNEGDALADVIARHHLDALRARPNDADVDTLRASALTWLGRAGERAGSTGAHPAAARLFASAAELVGGTDQPSDERSALLAADLWMQAARSRHFAGMWVDSMAASERAAELRAAHGHERLVALADGLRGRAMLLVDPDEARSLLRRAVAVLEQEPGTDTVELMSELSGAYALSGLAQSDELTERALVFAQELGAEDRLVADMLIHRGVFLNSRDRPIEATAMFREAQRRAEATGSINQRVRASLNLGDAVSWASPSEALLHALEAERLAREGGFRYYLGYSVVNIVLCSLLTGDWALAQDMVTRALDEDDLGDMAVVPPTAAVVWALRGEPDRSREALVSSDDSPRDPQERSFLDYARAVLAYAGGDVETASQRALSAATTSARVGLHSDIFVVAWPLAARLAQEVGDGRMVETLLELLDGRHHGVVPPLVGAEQRLALARALDDAADRVSAIEDAVADLRAVGSPYHLAQGLLDLAEAQQAAGKDPADVVEEAASIGTTLGAPHVEARAASLRTRPPGGARTSP